MYLLKKTPCVHIYVHIHNLFWVCVSVYVLEYMYIYIYIYTTYTCIYIYTYPHEWIIMSVAGELKCEKYISLLIQNKRWYLRNKIEKYYERTKWTKFLLAIIYGSPWRHSNGHKTGCFLSKDMQTPHPHRMAIFT